MKKSYTSFTEAYNNVYNNKFHRETPLSDLYSKVYENKDSDMVTSLMPSDEEIQRAIEEFKCSCAVEVVKDIIDKAIKHYVLDGVSINDLKSGLYEDYQDACNYSPNSGGKPRFDYKNTPVAVLATLLAKQLKYNTDTRERHARGENAEEHEDGYHLTAAQWEESMVDAFNRAVNKNDFCKPGDAFNWANKIKRNWEKAGDGQLALADAIIAIHKLTTGELRIGNA